IDVQKGPNWCSR
ncbi:major Facilitator Superfamily protein, partial [Vibrio parahaemolyticus EKP-021]